jgi:hypothetical protein
MKRTPSRRNHRPARPLPHIAATATAAATGIAAVLLPGTSAYANTDLQGESFSINSAYGTAYNDPTASGGRALAIWSNATATGTLQAASKFTQLQVTAMGGTCGATDAAPRMKVTVDGVQVATTSVTSKTWATYSFAGNWASGKRKIQVAFLNEYGSTTCDRFLEIDRVRGTTPSAASPAPTTTPAPTAAPTTAPTTAPGTTPPPATSEPTSPVTPPAEPSPSSPSGTSGFIARNGSSLTLDGKPFKFVGMNAFGMSGCEGAAWTDAQLDDYFSRLAPNTVTRTWAFQPYGTAPLDRIVAAAARHQQKVVLVLADGRNYCGEWDGAATREGGDKTTTWYTSGFRTNYLPWVKTVVSRFKDSPAVAYWEPINEPGSFSSSAYTDTMIKNFLDETAATIRASDANHLVASGTLSEDMYGTRDYAYLHSGPDIDIASLHEYDYDYQKSNVIISGHLKTVLSQMTALGKPLVVGETGIQAGTGCRTSATTRAAAIEQKLTGYLAYAPVAGVSVWSTVQYNPYAYETCPLEMQVTDPTIATIKVVQARLNG